MKKGMYATAAASVFLASAAAFAGTAKVDGLGGALSMNSGTVTGVFGASSPSFTDTALEAIHAALLADGVDTDGHVTSLLMDTDAGLAWVVLVDRQFNQIDLGNGGDATLSMNSSASSTNAEFINDDGSDISVVLDFGNGLQTAGGVFDWDGVETGDGFAWAGLVPGDFLSFNFEMMEGTIGEDALSAVDTFQFVSWNNGEWQLVDTGVFSQNSQFAYSVRVVPLPQPAVLGMAGLAAIGAIRRRKAV